MSRISDILEVSRIEDRKIALKVVPVNTSLFLPVIADVISTRAEMKGLQFIFEPAPNLPAGIMADELRLRQLLFHLLDNAIMFTSEGQIAFRVTVLSYQKKDLDKGISDRSTIRFEIRDSGIGIPADQLEKIFTPFEQVLETPIGGGAAGLGLTICRQLAHLMGGEIHIKSEVGHGSTFWVDLTFPAAEMEIAKRVTEKIPTGYKGPRKKILIVDDRPANRSVLVDWLNPLGFEIAEAENGNQAIAIAKEVHPDLIFMDLVMPEKDGFRATQEIRDISEISDTVIIAMSASAYNVTSEECKATGCNDFLPKPIDWQIMTNFMEKYLHLEWEYKEVGEGVEAPEVTELIIPPPSEVLNNLYKLALLGDMRQLTEHAKYIESLGEQYVPFARKLQSLAEGFQERAIMELVEKYWKRAA